MRSKALLVSNILATLYSVVLLWTFSGAIIEAGGMDFIDILAESFEIVFELLGAGSGVAAIIYVIMILLGIHILTFVVGSINGWIAYSVKKSGNAKSAAVFYLIGTICFPIYLFYGLPITIIGFVGSGKQKKLNNTTIE